MSVAAWFLILALGSAAPDAGISEPPPTPGERAIADHLAPLQRRCEQGDRVSCARLAYRLNALTNGREMRLLVASLTKGCAAHVAIACAGQGIGMMRGEDTDQQAAGLALVQKACDQRDAYACGQLAEVMMNESFGQTGKAAEGKALAERSCKDLGGWPCLSVATNPDLTPRDDLPRMVTYLERACDGDDPYGCYQAAMAHAEGPPGIAVDQKKATALYQRGCDRELGQACFNLAWQYLRGTGAPRDESRGRALLLRSCILGDAPGCDELSRREKNPRRYCDLWGAQACFDLAVEITKTGGEVADNAEALVRAGRLACRRAHDGGGNVMGHLARDHIRQCEAGENVANACTFAGLIHRDGLTLPHLAGASHPVDATKATAAFAKACKAGAKAACNLGATVRPGAPPSGGK